MEKKKIGINVNGRFMNHIFEKDIRVENCKTNNFVEHQNVLAAIGADLVSKYG